MGEREYGKQLWLRAALQSEAQGFAEVEKLFDDVSLPFFCALL